MYIYIYIYIGLTEVNPNSAHFLQVLTDKLLAEHGLNRYTHRYISTYLYLSICLSIHLSLHLYVYMSMSLYILRHIDTQIHR